MRVEWILPGLLAGSAKPGLLDELEDDMEQLRRLGFRLIVNLTEDAHEVPVAYWGFDSLHSPIPDMGITSPRAAMIVCLQILERLDEGDKVLVHCKAGLGRTGMILACCLVLRGETAINAVRRVRGTNQLFIQTLTQEKFITDFEVFAREVATGPK